MAETQKEELVRKTKSKIIELFGPESALAQAMEDEGFFDKLGELIAWLYGEIMLAQPRPEPRSEPWPYKPVSPVPPKQPWIDRKWERGWERGIVDFGAHVRASLGGKTDNYQS